MHAVECSARRGLRSAAGIINARPEGRKHIDADVPDHFTFDIIEGCCIFQDLH